MAELKDSDTLPDVKITGVILNLIYQSRMHMVKAGFCTNKQFRAGRKLLSTDMERYYESRGP